MNFTIELWVTIVSVYLSGANKRIFPARRSEFRTIFATHFVADPVADDWTTRIACVMADAACSELFPR
jgi:hypothetical protein